MVTANAEKICKRGHVGMYDKFRKCTGCNRIDSLARYHADPEKILAQKRAKRSAEPEEHKARDRVRYATNAPKIKIRVREIRRARPARELLNQARLRARKGNYPFTITEDDINMPVYCPLLGVQLKIGNGKFGSCSPTLDKIRPELGYVPGNIWVISHRANSIKSDATLEELKLLVFNLAAKRDGH